MTDTEGREPVAFFRADSSARLGAGHVMRCLALAGELRRAGCRCIFASAEQIPAVANAIRAAGHDIRPLGGEATSLLTHVRALERRRADLLVIDQYDCDVRFETACRDVADHILVVEDRIGTKHVADTLLDQNATRRPDEYRDRVPPSCRLLLGTRYALLRPEFRRHRAEALRRRRQAAGIGRILVNFGGGDNEELVGIALSAIRQSGVDAAIDVVLGSERSEAALIGADARGISVYRNTDRIAELMLRADLAIGGAGISSWERCCLALPAIVLVVAENQADNAAALAAANAAHVVEHPGAAAIENLADAIRRIARDREHRQRMASSAAAICDGLGAPRVACALVGAAAGEGHAVKLRPAEPGDSGRLLRWRSHPLVARFARRPPPATVEQHDAWYEGMLASAATELSIILFDGQPAGMIRLDRRDDEADRFEVSISVDPTFHGIGIGKAALRLARRLMPEAVLEAEILPGNEVSQRLFAGAGYRQVGGGWYRADPTEEAA
jgi:UDP-2,4-diacetamido-2,4,6-trideoxy-beta-L-altropyranose hydrolase